MDIAASAEAVLGDLGKGLDLSTSQYDAILVACFSVHTLVPELLRRSNVAVTGIFEASILSALSLLPAAGSQEKWGIVTTGKFSEDHLTNGVNEFLGQNGADQNRKFAGTYSTGLNAGDFHVVPPEEVQAKLKEATTKLLKTGKVTCVVMGCGGMAGLEDIIRSTAAEVYGEEDANNLYVLDGVKAGILQLEQTIYGRRAFR